MPFDVIGPISFPVAVWLVQSGDRWTVIDTGVPSFADDVVAAIARVTRGVAPHQILLTHAHYDHGGGLSAIRMAWNPPVICHQDEAVFVTGEMEYRHLSSRNLAYLIGRYFFPAASWGIPVAQTLERGEAISGMVVIHLPGHSPGHIGFLHPEDQAMLCGDAIMNLNDRLSPPISFSTPEPDQAQASIRRLAELDYLHLLPSHGEPILHRGRQAIMQYLGIGAEEELW